MLDHTHDPALRSWVASANGHADFPIQNLPLGIFRHREQAAGARVGIAIGDSVLDLAACAEAGLLDVGVDDRWFEHFALNPILAAGRPLLTKLRHRLVEILREGSAHRDTANAALLDAASVEMLLPIRVGDYTDFYASVHHATNVGSMFRPDNPLLPNYKWVPIGYHGRSSSIVVSGTEVRRPNGQTREGEAPPVYGPSKRLDYEMELGIVVGAETELGDTISIDDAEQHVAGFVLVNDWSARDVQTWEYQPLGPFLAKNFATTISPWVVTLDALEPYRAAAFSRDANDPQPLPYLTSFEDQQRGGIDLTVEVSLRTATMRAQGMAPQRISRGNFRDMYWTFAQLLTHHASNGCNLRSGDLLASGTISGTTKDARGCLLELTWRGTEPIELPGGEQRRFLEDGDEVIMRAFCESEGHARIGFGECRGTIAPARP